MIKVRMQIQMFALFVMLLLSACGNGLGPDTAPAETSPPAFTPTATQIPSFTPTNTLTLTLTSTATPTVTPTPTETPTPTIEPTYTVLRGKVLAEQIACRFGPGAMYLFKYSVFKDTVLEILGRMERSTWILVQAVGGSNPCWVNGEHMEIRGEINAVAPTDPHKVLAWSPYYDALTGVSAVRDGDVVTVYWNQLVLRAGDSSEQVPYVVEAWVCRDGEIVFAPVGAYSLAAEVIDEPGCDQLSYVRVMGAEKHGYTRWRVVDWPQAEVEPAPTP